MWPTKLLYPLFFQRSTNFFHVSQLRKYVSDPSHIIEPDIVPLKDNLSYESPPIRIEDQRIKQLRGMSISLVRVVWDQVTGDITWELEDKMRLQYPKLFEGMRISRTDFFL
jgi:hypothetical protein